jgi:hypothetical protein
MKYDWLCIFLHMFKSTVDWCEANYAVTPLIAEFWNSLSGFALIISSIMFYQTNYQYKEYFNIITFLLICTGIGTIMFHSTLLYPFQLLDELPMLILSNEYLILLLSLQTTMYSIKSFDYFNFICNHLLKIVPIIVSSYFIKITFQIILFHITLKVFEVSIVYTLYKLSKRLNDIVYCKLYEKYNMYNKYNKYHNYNIVKYKSTQNSYDLNYNIYSNFHLLQNDIKIYNNIRKKMSKSIKYGILFYVCSMSIWCIENLFCNIVQPFQLHALWHILSSIGIFHLNNIIKYHIQINNLYYNSNLNSYIYPK